MKKILLSLAILFFYTAAFAQSGAKNGEFDLSGINDLRMMVDTGMEITINGTDSKNLTYEYEFAGNKESYDHFFKNFDPEFESQGGRSSFAIEFPKQSGNRVNHEITRHTMVINLPRDIVFELVTRYSKVNASNFDRGVSILNRSGLVKIENVKQVVTVNNEYGDVIITNVDGELMILNRSANVDVRDIIGDVSMTTEYSKMNISKIQGTVDISNRSGTLNAFDITGDMKLSGSYMEYELTNISGDVSMSNKSGNVSITNANSFAINGEYTHVEATDITGSNGVELSGRSANVILKNIAENVLIDGQYLNINLQNIGGEARIYNKSAGVKIDGLEKDLMIEGEYIPIDVKNFRGANLEIVNRSNDITIEAVNELQNVSIESDYGDVTLRLKKKYAGSVNIETKYGKFISSMVLSSQQVSKSLNSQVISGAAGTGSGEMRIKTTNADIRVDQ